MTTLILLPWFAACDGGMDDTDSGLPPDVFAARITSHNEGDTLLAGYRVGLAGEVNDPDGVNGDVAVTWLVDGVEECPESTADANGGTTCDVVFAAGELEVVLKARASDGESLQVNLTLEVLETEAPTATIHEPLEGAVVTNDPGVYMMGIVTDAEDGPSALLTTWSSSVQGPLVGSTEPGGDGTAEALVVLDVGLHTLTLDVIDATGKSGSDSVTVTVE